MDILVFKILTDVCFYMAMFMPLFLSGPLWVRVLLFLALASWCVWLLICWKKRNMEERAHDSLMTEARLLLAAGCIQWLSLGTEVWGRRCVPVFYSLPGSRDLPFKGPAPGPDGTGERRLLGKDCRGASGGAGGGRHPFQPGCDRRASVRL